MILGPPDDDAPRGWDAWCALTPEEVARWPWTPRMAVSLRCPRGTGGPAMVRVRRADYFVLGLVHLTCSGSTDEALAVMLWLMARMTPAALEYLNRTGGLGAVVVAAECALGFRTGGTP